MPLDLYDTLLSQLAEMRFKGRLSPVFYNEPMLDERLPDLMRRARSALPRAYLTLYTNGSLLTRENLIELVDSGMDGIYVSQYEENLQIDDVSQILSDLPATTKKRVRYRVLTNNLPLSTRGGLVDVGKPISKKFCFQASTDAVVDHKGDVVLCCNDYYTKYVFGNIKEENIKKIWNKPEFKSVRKQLRKGRFREEMCRSCAGLN
jgi:8-amino-3,8-dideoxy-alpha-D-manno-octulosonate transaminase